MQSPDAHLPQTARQILDVAERLWAERGIAGASLREIVLASGTRNLSAAQYHFGSREALLALLIGRRVYFINELRHARLDALDASHSMGDAAAVVTETVRALADVVRDQPWGSNYVRVVAQVLLDPASQAVFEQSDWSNWSGHERTRLLLRALLPTLSEADFRDRLRIVNNEIVFCLARWVQSHGGVTAQTRTRYETLVRHTAAFLAAGMVAAAPVPAPARPRLATRKPRRKAA